MANNENFKYGIYNPDEVSSGYFGESPKKVNNVDNFLISSGIDLPTPKEEKTKGVSFVGDIIEDVISGARTLGADINRIQEGRLEDTEGLLGKFLQAGEGRKEKIEETFKAIDEAGGGEVDKLIVTAGNVLGAGFDFAGDVIASGIKTLAPEGLETATKETVSDFIQTDFGKATVDFIKTGGEKYEAFKESSPEAKRFGLTVESLLPLTELFGFGKGAKVGKELIEEGVEAGVEFGTKQLPKITEGIETLTSGARDKIESIKEFKPKLGVPEDEKLLKKLSLETEKGIIDGKEVDIPKVEKGVVEKISKPFREGDTKVLAGRALSPRTVGKSAKQKLKSIQDVEKNANEFYKNVRTGVIEGDISTIENASQTIIDNIDKIGARIGDAVKKVDGTIKIDNDLTDSIIDALGAKGATVSPATSILTKFLDDLGDGTLSIADAFELKKAYGNEVTKLYKAGDSGTKQYKALSDGVKSINKQIDEIIDTKLGNEFAKDKEVFRNLKTIVDDIVASTLVEGRRSPNTFAEQLGMIEGLLSPVESIKQTFIKEIGELNTRGGAWKELIKIYDAQAINNLKNIKK